MQFLLLLPGKTKFHFYQEAIEHYKKAISPFAELELIVLKASDSLEKEEEKILDTLNRRKLREGGKNLLVLLDEKGKNFTSIELAKQFTNYQERGISKVCFLIGG